MLQNLAHELKQNIDPIYKDGAIRYFKEKIKIIGVRAPIVKKIGAKYYLQIDPKDKATIFALVEKLLPKENEYKSIALNWLWRIKKLYQPSDFTIFEIWLKKYVTNWATCDDFCGHALGFLIYSHPQLIPKVKAWHNSPNRWLRRASAVSLIYSLRRGKYLTESFWIAKKLLVDEDDLVRKGYGWLLKEGTKKYPKEIFEFVMQNKTKMPRVALRYAIEKLPREMWKMAMG